MYHLHWSHHSVVVCSAAYIISAKLFSVSWWMENRRHTNISAELFSISWHPRKAGNLLNCSHFWYNYNVLSEYTLSSYTGHQLTSFAFQYCSLNYLTLELTIYNCREITSVWLAWNFKLISNFCGLKDCREITSAWNFKLISNFCVMSVWNFNFSSNLPEW